MKVMHILLSPLFFNHKLSQVFSEMKFRIVLLFLMFTWNRPHGRDVLTMRFCSKRFNHFFRFLSNFRCFRAIFWCNIQHAPNQTLKTLIPIIHNRIAQYREFLCQEVVQTFCDIHVESTSELFFQTFLTKEKKC